MGNAIPGLSGLGLVWLSMNHPNTWLSCGRGKLSHLLRVSFLSPLKITCLIHEERYEKFPLTFVRLSGTRVVTHMLMACYTCKYVVTRMEMSCYKTESNYFTRV